MNGFRIEPPLLVKDTRSLGALHDHARAFVKEALERGC
jgi:hypothetical protein